MSQAAKLNIMSPAPSQNERRGRPEAQPAYRMEGPLLALVDKWIATQPDPKPSRADAVLRIVQDHGLIEIERDRLEGDLLAIRAGSRERIVSYGEFDPETGETTQVKEIIREISDGENTDARRAVGELLSHSLEQADRLAALNFFVFSRLDSLNSSVPSDATTGLMLIIDDIVVASRDASDKARNVLFPEGDAAQRA